MMDYLHYIAVEKFQQEKTLELLTEIVNRIIEIEKKLQGLIE